jgi:large subunit ribosomal protein L13
MTTVPATKIKNTTKSYMAKPGEVPAKWFLVDATDKVVGRLASEIAMILMGKHRPTYTPHVECGDFVIVVNAEKIAFSGKKWQLKEYRWYTGYHGLQIESAEHRRDRRPELIISEQRRMLPKKQAGHENARQAQGIRRQRAPASGPRAGTEGIGSQIGHSDIRHSDFVIPNE